MNYYAHYSRLISRARDRVLLGYSEKHHVVPRCLGGADTPDNLVTLTAEEHFVAHQLLVKIHPGNHRISYAAMIMTGSSRGRLKRSNNKLFGWLRRRHAKNLAVAFKGKGPSPETAAKIAAKNRGRKNGPCSDERRAKVSAANKGRKLPPEFGTAVRARLLGKKRAAHSVETKAKMSLASKGRKKSPEHCAALSAAKLGKKRGPHSLAHRAALSASMKAALQRGKEVYGGRIQ